MATDGAGVPSSSARHLSSGVDWVAERSVDSSAVDVLRKGVSVDLAGTDLLVGHPSLFGSNEWDVPSQATRRAERATEAGDVPVFVGYAGDVLGTITVGDTPRGEWESVVEAIAEGGREVIVLTGDSEAAASRFRDHPAVSTTLTGVPPDGKVAAIQGFNQRGTTAMVGDGINDAPALAAADVGISIASGTALTADAADAIVVADGLNAIPELFRVAPRTRRRIRENLGWAFVYNGVAIPLALFGLINPLLAAVAMTTSSLLVVCNSNRKL